MKKGFLLVWAGVLIALVFSLFSPAASDPVVTEEFTRIPKISLLHMRLNGITKT